MNRVFWRPFLYREDSTIGSLQLEPGLNYQSKVIALAPCLTCRFEPKLDRFYWSHSTSLLPSTTWSSITSQESHVRSLGVRSNVVYD